MRGKEVFPMTAISSPCKQLCQISREDNLCTGCARTLDEIGQWSRMGEDQRQSIMAELPQRMANFQAKRRAFRRQTRMRRRAG